MNNDRVFGLDDAVVAIIRTPSIDEETARLALSVIAVDAIFNMRASDQKKHGIAEDKLWALLEISEKVIEESRILASDVARGISNKEVQDRLLALRSRMMGHF